MNPLEAERLADVTEKEWASQVVELASMLGWSRYHTYRSSRSASGWPDEALVRDRLLLAELKREQGKPTEAQIEWLDRLANAGVEAYLWRPSDLAEIAEILSKRWRYQGHALTLNDASRPWTPRSLWLPGQGRADSN